ncbi:MAG: lipoprotein NlpD [Rhodoferax sp.]|jgi:lipoprotein NlpD
MKSAGVLDPNASAVQQLPGFENAGKPGYYSVKPGDTLIRIGLEQGQSSRDIARWSNLENPNLIEIGQVLRVAPPVVVASTKPVVRPVTQGSITPIVTPQVPAAKTSSAPAPAPAASGSDDDINWMWPTNGAVLAGFDEVKNKGIDMGGKAGDPVLAAADGRVVYVGAGLRGYGNLIILKHNNTYLTAYAHNQALLIKEDQSVRRGQKIAEMGSSDADRVKLHFEVRRQGKPVDPARYLPAR